MLHRRDISSTSILIGFKCHPFTFMQICDAAFSAIVSISNLTDIIHCSCCFTSVLKKYKTNLLLSVKMFHVANAH